MKQSQKGFSSLVTVIAVIAVLVIAGLYLSKNKLTSPSSPIQPTHQTNTSENAPIQNDSDLNKTLEDLNGINIDATIDPQLNQNDADAKAF